MKVAELIAELQKFRPDANVEVICPYDNNTCATGGPVVGVYLDEGVVVIDADEG